MELCELSSTSSFSLGETLNRRLLAVKLRHRFLHQFYSELKKKKKHRHQTLCCVFVGDWTPVSVSTVSLPARRLIHHNWSPNGAFNAPLMTGIFGHSCHAGLTADLGKQSHAWACSRSMGLFFCSSSVIHVIVANAAVNPLKLKDVWNQNHWLLCVWLTESWKDQFMQLSLKLHSRFREKLFNKTGLKKKKGLKVLIRFFLELQNNVNGLHQLRSDIRVLAVMWPASRGVMWY